jgi:hypothetical protein
VDADDVARLTWLEESLWRPATRFVLPLPGLRVRGLGPDVALLTYRSETTYPDDGVTLVANRSSLWQRIEGEWRLRFHQGTPVH